MGFHHRGLLRIALSLGLVGCQGGSTSAAHALFFDSAAQTTELPIRGGIRLTPRWQRTLVDVASIGGVSVLGGGDVIVVAAQVDDSATDLLFITSEETARADFMPRLGSQGLLLEAFRNDTALVFDRATQGLWMVTGPGVDQAARCTTLADTDVYLVGSLGLEGGALLLGPERDPMIGRRGKRWTSVDMVDVPCGVGPARPLWELPRNEILWSPRERMNLLFGAEGQVVSAGRYLVAGTSDQARLLVRDMYSTASPAWVTWNVASQRPVTQEDIVAWSRWRSSHHRDSVRFPGQVVRPAELHPQFSRLRGESDGAVWVEQYRWYTPYVPGPDTLGTTTWYRLDLERRIGHSLDLPNTDLLVAAQTDAVVTLQRLGEAEWVLAVHEWSVEADERFPE